MTDLDPETFEEEKYVDYFPKLQQAYKNAFNRVNEQYDAELVHAIDQQVLNESEPHYEGDGEFTIDLPDDPYDRLEGVLADREKFDAVLDAYLDEIKTELERVFSV
ncbi:DUF5783 family protein [Halorubellus salinus]|mgnify:FL=1|uniref:DUF5783 family protein n=1 Tax=Halorubellus salinus TaxID=755309 RepID=UPI001D07F133|nr:DUF5783 family protein [Halorubellus salinus]